MAKLKHGINYRPNINYTLEKVPPTRYRDNITRPENFFSTELARESIKETEIELDFLITKAEENLNEYEDFKEYKNLAIKRYYCNQPLSGIDFEKLKSFESKLNGIDGNITIDIYPTLLSIKSDINNNKGYIDRSEKIEHKLLNRYSKYISDNWDIKYPDIKIDDQFQTDNNYISYEKIINIDNQLNTLNQKIKTMTEEKKNALQLKELDRVDYLDGRIKKGKADINKTKNRISYLSSEAYALNENANSTNNYLNKIAFELLSSPLDRLGDSARCMFYLLLNKAGIEKNSSEIDKNIQKVKTAINSFKGIISLAHQDIFKSVNNSWDDALRLVLSPVRSLITLQSNALKSFESDIIMDAEDFFSDILDNDIENPNNVFDCLYFESFADFIYDEIDNIFAEIKEKIVDLYKFTKSRSSLLDTFSVNLSKKSRLQSIYDALDQFSNFLDSIDPDNLLNDFENTIKSFFNNAGYNMKYNMETGGYSEHSSDKKTNNKPVIQEPFLPQEGNDVKTIIVSKNPEYIEFKDNYTPITYQCNFYNELENSINQSNELFKKEINKYEST
ncbi:MAG: hypothetical protein ACOCRO_02025 [Halanaerobiales bacterium]